MGVITVSRMVRTLPRYVVTYICNYVDAGKSLENLGYISRDNQQVYKENINIKLNMKLSEIKSHQFDDNPVIYRLTNIVNDRNYIGLAMYGIHDRLFNKRHGYIEIYNKWRDELNIEPGTLDLFLTIKEAIVIYGLDNFELTIEGAPSDTLNEEVLIARYDSVINGYNKTLDGLDIFHTKYKLKAVNNGVKEIRIPEILLDRIKDLPNIFIGSIKSSHTRSDRFIWMNDGDMNIRVPINLYSEFSLRGFIKTKRSDSSKFRRGIVKAHDDQGNIILLPDKSSIPYGFKIGLNDSKRSLKGKVAVTNGTETRYINRDDLNLPEYFEFHLGRIQETNKGRIIINKDGKEKRIKPEDLNKYKDDNWVEGHSSSFNILISERMWVNNGENTINIREDEYPDYEKKGYKPGILGRSKSPNKGKIAINKNGKTKYIDKCEIPYFINIEGYSLGAAKNPKLASNSTKGRKAMTDGSITVFVKINEVPEYESKGFRLGMAPRNKKK